MKAKYETEKKETEIQVLSQENEIKNLRISEQENKVRKQRMIIYSAVAGFIIILAFSLIVLRLYRQKRQANRQLEIQNKEIMQQKEEIATQRDEIEAQRDLVAEQKEHIEAIHHELTDSIHYAERIQTAVLPEKPLIFSLFESYFVMFHPQGIVSGDFYWCAEVEGKKLVAAADCTGHGVPGAFMSMLGISFMNEIIISQKITETDQILNKLRAQIIKALHQQGANDDLANEKVITDGVKDGMDISIICLNGNDTVCQFSGANNPLYILRKTADEIEVLEYKGDKMPISIYPNMTSFSKTEISLNKKDRIFLFSDGFADQFGGENGKKFKYKPFKNLLQSCYDMPMKEQHQVMEEKLAGWMNHLDPYSGRRFEQTDDITVVGIEIC